MTVMDNLHSKGLVCREKQGKAYLYTPVSSRDEHTAEVLQEVLADSQDRTAALMHLVGKMDPSDAAELLRRCRSEWTRPVTAALLLSRSPASCPSLGSRLLCRQWALRSPRVAVVGWQALSTSVVASILLAAVALALPFLPLRFSLAYLLGAHTLTVVEHYETPLGSWPGVAGLALVAGLTVMLVATTTRSLGERAACRRSQLNALQLVGRPHPGGFIVIEHEVPLAYCLPSGGDRDSGAVLLGGCVA